MSVCSSVILRTTLILVLCACHASETYNPLTMMRQAAASSSRCKSGSRTGNRFHSLCSPHSHGLWSEPRDPEQENVSAASRRHFRSRRGGRFRRTQTGRDRFFDMMCAAPSRIPQSDSGALSCHPNMHARRLPPSTSTGTSHEARDKRYDVALRVILSERSERRISFYGFDLPTPRVDSCVPHVISPK